MNIIMTIEEELMAYRMLIKGSHFLMLNMNDTFGFATDDAETMDVDDLKLMLPVIYKYGHHALIAYAAIKGDREPIHCKCGHDSEPFHKAKAEIVALKKENKYFLYE